MEIGIWKGCVMEFMKAKCPVCAKCIQVPSDLEKPYCVYCGARFLRDAALAYAGTVVSTAKVKQSDPSDFVIVGGTLVDYRGSAAEVSIPEGITCIGEDAFKGNMSIVSVSMPDTVTSIGNSAFCGCSSMQKVRLSESLVTIESYGFQRCSSLKEVKLPRTVKTIGSWCFGGCSSMEAFYYPDGISYGSYCFEKNPAKQVKI